MAKEEGPMDKTRPAEDAAEPEQKPEPRMTPLRRAAGLERIKDPTAPEKRILIRAGFSPATAHTPAKNDLDTFELARRVRHEASITPTQAGKLGLKIAAELAQDKAQGGAVRGSAAKLLLDVGAGADDTPPIGRREWLYAWLEMSTKLRRWTLLALRDPERAIRCLERLARHQLRWADEHARLASTSDRRWNPGPRE